MNLTINIYGLEIEAILHSKELKQRISNDFSYFLVNRKAVNPIRTLICHLDSFDKTKIPQTRPFIQNEKLIAYKSCGSKVYNYHYKALVTEQFNPHITEIISDNIDHLHELTYLYILSITGKKLDYLGMHKIHGMALRFTHVNLLYLAPSKGGKSTTFLQLLNRDDVSFYSDDTPIICHEGNIHPFPLRVGLNNHYKDYHYIDQKLVYTLNRMNHGEKKLVSIEGVNRAIAKSNNLPNIVLIAKRANMRYPKIRGLSFFHSFTQLIEYLIVGLGLPMIAEFFVTHSFRDYPDGVRILFSRLISAYKLVRNACFYEILLTEDPILNAKEINNFVNKWTKDR